MLPTVLISALAAVAVAAPLEQNGIISSLLARSSGSPGPAHLPLIRSRAPVTRRLRKRQIGSGESNDTLYSNVAATAYSTIVKVGTPPQEIMTTVDTGSTAFVVMSDTCLDDQCNTNYRFHSTQSSTFQQMGHASHQGYLDNSSYDGMWAKDTVEIANYTLSEFGFVLVNRTANEGDSRSLIGFGWPSDDEHEPPSWPYQWSKDWDNPSFGMYLGRLQGTEDGVEFSDDYASGLLTLGGISEELIDGEPKYAPLMKPGANSWGQEWMVELQGLRIGNYSLRTNKTQTALIDSGTSAMVGPPKVLEDLFSQIPGAQGINGSYYVPCNMSDFNVTIKLAGTEWPLYWGDFMSLDTDLSPDQELCSSGFEADENVEDDKWVVGDAFMRNVYTVFRYRPASVGFAKLKDKYNIRSERMRDDYLTPIVNDTSPTASNSNSTDIKPTDGSKPKDGNGATSKLVGLSTVLFALATAVVLTI